MFTLDWDFEEKDGLQSYTRNVRPARHAWRGRGGRSRRSLKKSSTRKDWRAPRALDPGEISEVSKVSAESGEGGGSGGKPSSASAVRSPKRSQASPGADPRPKHRPEPAARRPSRPTPRAQSRNPGAREAGSPALTLTSPTPPSRPRLNAVRRRRDPRPTRAATAGKPAARVLVVGKGREVQDRDSQGAGVTLAYGKPVSLATAQLLCPPLVPPRLSLPPLYLQRRLESRGSCSHPSPPRLRAVVPGHADFKES
nr:cyclic GMP-AMP synthase-like [Dasypus novemcinctus]